MQIVNDTLIYTFHTKSRFLTSQICMWRQERRSVQSHSGFERVCFMYLEIQYKFLCALRLYSEDCCDSGAIAAISLWTFSSQKENFINMEEDGHTIIYLMYECGQRNWHPVLFLSNVWTGPWSLHIEFTIFTDLKFTGDNVLQLFYSFYILITYVVWSKCKLTVL